MDRKKMVWVSILVILAIGSVVFGLRRAGRPPPPKEVTDRLTEKVDVETLEVMELSYSEWDDLGERDGLYKNPKTGTYTMSKRIFCDSCHAKIPDLVFPQVDDFDDPNEYENAVDDLVSKYKCPKCGRPAIRVGGPGR